MIKIKNNTASLGLKIGDTFESVEEMRSLVSDWLLEGGMENAEKRGQYIDEWMEEVSYEKVDEVKEEIEKILSSDNWEELRKVRDENAVPNIELHPVSGCLLGAATYRMNELSGKSVLPLDVKWFMKEYFGE